jgi:hypothetical protein
MHRPLLPLAPVASFLALTILAACASGAGSGGSSAPAQGGAGGGETSSGAAPSVAPTYDESDRGAPDCDSQCCATPRPSEGESCTGDGTACGDVQWCPSGLVTDERVLTCTSGVWKPSGGGCPADNEVDDRGCPGAQPTSGSACTAAEGTVCHYALVCTIGTCPDAGTASDGGTLGTGCTPAKRVTHEDATCTGGTWSTQALGVCPTN